MSLVYFTSDLHLGHSLAAKKRGFGSVEEHDKSVIKSLFVAKKRDKLFILGDIAMQKDRLALIAQLPCKNKVLLLGNHDKFHAMEYLAVFQDIIGPVTYKDYWLTHIPMHPQELYRRNGNLHGHIHKGGASPSLDLPYFNVNWDWHRRPVLYQEIDKIMTQV